MQVHVGSEHVFVNPAARRLLVRGVESRSGRVVLEGREPPPGWAEFQGTAAKCGGLDVFIVFPVERKPTAEEQRRIADLLREHIGPAPVAFVIEDATGRATVEIADADLGEEAAAAVAVLKASGAWDESESFEITVNGTVHRLVARHEADGWRAEVHAPG